VFMSCEYVGTGEDSTVVELGLERRTGSKGRSPPLRATLVWGKFGNGESGEKTHVDWGRQEDGRKNVTIRLDPSLLRSKEDDAVLAEVTHVTSGYIDDRRSKTLIGLMNENQVPLFGMVENKTFTCGETPQLEVVLENGTITGELPSLVQYSYKTVVQKEFQKFLSHPIEQSGIIRFKPGQKVGSINVPVSWKVLPPQARFSIEMMLMPLYKSRVQNSGTLVYVAHILGTRRGVCPPGSAEKDSTESAGGQKQPQQGDNLTVKIGDALVDLSLHAKHDDQVTLYRRNGMLADDIVAVVDTMVDGMQMCLSSLIPITVEGGRDTLLPLEVNVVCPSNMSEYELKLSIGWDQLMLKKMDSHGLTNNSTATLTVRRKADRRHALLESLKIVPSTGETIIACEQFKPTMTVKRAENSRDVLKQGNRECTPNDSIRIELNSDTESVQMIPRLLIDNVPGVRVEMNGQVVVYSGSDGIEEEQYSDSHPFSAIPKARSERIMTDAYIMNLPRGYEVPVEIVVFAEDGTTSSTLTVKLHRKSPSLKQTLVTTDVPTHLSLDTMLYGQDDFDHCTVCMPGWVSPVPGSSLCSLCPPGTFADYDGSQCSSCTEGTYAMSWGSSRCKHCIEGTFAPSTGAKYCMVCPESTTTDGDGQHVCSIPLGTLNVRNRYAVLIHVSVTLSGIDENTLILKSGVSGSPDRLISNLVTSDMAKAFNTTKAAVSVKSIRRLSDRNFETNLSASLPVYIPPSATEEDISTALQIERLSADSPLEMLANAPDMFFGQTTDVLQAHVESAAFKTEEHFPESNNELMVSLLVIGSLGIVAGLMLVLIAFQKQRKNSSAHVESRFLLPRQENNAVPLRNSIGI
jgi:hypothetical protein